MRLTVQALCTALAWALSSSAVWAQALYLPGFFIGGFGDGLHIDKRKAGYYRAYSDNDNFDGIELTRQRFYQNDWNSQGEQVAYVFKSRDAQGQINNFALGRSTLNTDQPLWTADAIVSRPLGEQTTAEFAFNRDRVEVRQSLVSHVSADNYSVQLEQKLADPLRALFTAVETRFSDGNQRPTLKFKISYDVLPVQGISLQLRGRYFKNTDTSVISGYFNPSRFVENIAAVEINQTVQGWNLTGNFGWGRQAGGNDPKTLTKAFEVAATTPVASRLFVRAKAGYFRSLGYNGPDFMFRFVSQDLIFVF